MILGALLQRADLIVEATWDDFAGSKYTLETQRMIVLARKPGLENSAQLRGP